MNELVEARLAKLRAQLAEGERALADLDARREQLVANLLRLSGAAQVLAELAAEAAEVPGGTGPGRVGAQAAHRSQAASPAA